MRVRFADTMYMVFRVADGVHLSPKTFAALRLVGYAAFLAQPLFYLMGKGDSSWELGIGVASSAICIAGAIIYICAGRLVLRGVSRAALRPVFRPYILGTALFAGIVALQAAFFLTV